MNFYYDWENGFSTDLNWGFSDHVMVTLNGSPVHLVKRCMTGDRGFVERYVADENGYVRTNDFGLPDTVIEKGEVRLARILHGIQTAS